MAAVQHVFAFAIAIAISFLSLFYARRQLLALRRLRETPELPTAELHRERNQSRRRLISSGLMLLIAVLLVIAQLWLESPAQRLADLRDHSDVPLTDNQKDFVRLYGAVWIAILLLLLAVILLAAFDLWAIRRYGRQQHRKLSDDRRAMVARQLRRLRQERNGD